MTEGDVQIAIYNYRRGIAPFPIILTNIYFWHWESDALYITKSGYLHEYEIKVSHSDFLADAKKVSKHQRLAGGSVHGPAEFYYVCPPSIIAVEELPDYAGLFYTRERKGRYDDDPLQILTLDLIRRARRRPSQKIEAAKWKEFTGKAIDRYWSLRMHRYSKGAMHDS